MVLHLKQGWKILQDVHGTGEAMGIQNPDFAASTGNQVSEWEDLPELKQLQLIYASEPYFGRELRYFNQAPWWYRLDFEVDAEASGCAILQFTNVDYYCKVWLNGQFAGEHEGYSMPFQFRVDGMIQAGNNTLVVKVWSPWDDAVDGGRYDLRTFLVNRNQIKGTYEHADTFVQRDVNPVGMYGEVTLKLSKAACFEEAPDVTYELDAGLKAAELSVHAPIINVDGKAHKLRMHLTDRLTKQTLCRVEQDAAAGDTITARVENIRLWSTWDKGGAWLYDVRIELLDGAGNVLDSHGEPLGFRKIEMVRDEKQTRFFLNGRSFYARGTSYFPDAYVSNMCRERYQRDMLSVKAAGFNLIRIHVHVELPVLYEICSEVGIGILQDSEYNWMHPVTDEFADRFVNLYLATVKMLKRHASMFCWICMNEPGLQDPKGKSTGRAMTVNPGPRLYASVREMDPSRPAIKGSYCEDDPDSGDSHNYAGSLNGDNTQYPDIYGTTEKFNTEYGFDAPPCLFSLAKCPKAMKRLDAILDRIPEIGDYQYKLLKYYTEHYRMQKYSPNGGYVQFLFGDLCPQSFYGIYDYWGLPKPGLNAMLESNMPIGIFLKYNDKKVEAIYAVSDGDEAMDQLTVEYVFTDEKGDVVATESKAIRMDADDIVECWKLDLKLSGTINCALILRKGDKIIASNHYEDLFNFPGHVKGHPSRMSHETGMRLYFA